LVVTGAWEVVEGSTVVEAARYDPAACRIFVRTHGGHVQGYEDCSDQDWTEFMASHTSKGEYLTRILSRKREVARAAAFPRPPRHSGINRALVLNAFSPAQELDEPSRFAGRRAQILALADALQTKGSVPLIFGDRGLGKSSLAVQGQLIAMGDDALLRHLGAVSHAIPSDRAFLTVFVACSDEISQTSELLQALINAAEDVVPADEAGDEATFLVDRSRRTKVSLKLFEAETTKRFGVAQERLTFENLSLPEKLQRVTRTLNETFDAPVLYIVDELDRMSDKTGLASVLKRLSTDYLKFMVVGIAQDWSDLILDHSSLERQVTPIRVPRMSPPELAEVVDLAARYLEREGLGVRFSPEARTRLVQMSGGFPWFIHVIGQAALMLADDESVDVVDDRSVIHAIRGLVSNQFAQHFADTYQMAVRDSSQREIVLRAFAAWKSADIPTSAIYPVVKNLGVRNPSIYMGQLCGDQYGSVLMKPGFQSQGLVRFRNQMFKQYVFLAPSLSENVDVQVTEAIQAGSINHP
jgi:hypothetical protein